MDRTDCLGSMPNPMRHGFSEAIERDGFAIAPRVFPAESIAAVLEQFKDVPRSESTRRRGQSDFGIRNLLEVVPYVRQVADSPSIRSLAESIAGVGARVVRAIFFDKTAEANWKVAWHQDLTIAVSQRIEVPGFSSWSSKANVAHVQPPTSILEQLLTLRLHLDAADEQTGALKVIPGSHKHGRLSADEIEQFKQTAKPVTCAVEEGDVLLMRPLLLHASSASTAVHRRVIHLEFSSTALPGGLEWALQ